MELHPSAVLVEFSSQGETIRQLCRKNKTFRTVCSDYQQCFNALCYWNNSNLTEAPQRRREYEAMLTELKSEISLILNDLNPSETCGRGNRH